MTVRSRSIDRYLCAATVVAAVMCATVRTEAQGPALGGPGSVVGPGYGGPLPPPSNMLPSAGPPPGTGAGGDAPGSGDPNPASVVPSQPTITDVRVVGNRAVPLQKISPYIKTRAGRPFNQQMLEEDVTRLHKTKQFINVDTKVQPAPGGGVVVLFQVVERQTLAYVKYVGVTIRMKSVEKQTNLKAGDPIDPFMISDAAGKLESYYRTKGYPHAKVSVIEGNKVGDRGAIFLINEGQKQRVWSVKFEGNTIASDGRLKTQVKSKPPILLMFKGEVDREKIDKDVDNLQAYYRSLGFFGARIGRELEFNEKENWLTLTFVIDEGPRYKVRDISVIGNTKISSEELLKDHKLKSGDFFDQSNADADLTKMNDKYGGTGYVFAAVAPELRFHEQPGELDLVYQVQEGARYHIGRIEVRINGDHPRTRRHTVMNRVSLHPGQIADVRELRDSERRLKGSGLFQNNPAQGNPPTVKFMRPELDGLSPDDEGGGGGESRSASRGRGRGAGYRGQSPDPFSRDLPSVQPLDPRGPSQPIDVVVDLWLTPEQLKLLDAMDQIEEQEQGHVIVRAQSPGYYPADNGFSTTWPAGSGAVQSQGWPPAAGVGQVPMRRPDPDANISSTYQTPYTPPGPTPPGGTRVAMQPAAAQPVLQAAPGAPPYNPGAPAYNPGAPYGYGVPPAAGQAYPPQVIGGPSQQFANPVIPANPSAPYAPTPPTVQGVPFNPGVGGAAPGAPPNGYDNFGQIGQVVPPADALSPGGQFMTGQEPTQPVNVLVNASETQTGRFMAGVGVNSSSGLVGNIVLEEQNFDWRRWPGSWEDVRSGTAFRGAGQQFRLEAIPGTQVSRYSATFREPYLFDTNVSFGLSGYYYNRYFRDWTEQRAGGNIRLGYQLTPDLQTAFTLRAEDVRVYNPRVIPGPAALQAVLGENGLYTARWDLIHDTRDSPFLPTQGHYVNLGFEQAFGSYVFSRGTVDARRHFMLRERPDHSGRHVVNMYTNLGFTGDNTPLFENFFAGGIPTLRGFQFRGASPQENGVQVGGHFQWLNTVEYMFPLTPDDMLRGVVFCDFGTVEPDTRLVWQDFRIAPGLGLRISLPAMGPAPIALDFAVPVNYNPNDNLQVFSFMVGAGR